MVLAVISQNAQNNLIKYLKFLSNFIINLNYFYYEEIIYTCCSLGNGLGSKCTRG